MPRKLISGFIHELRCRNVLRVGAAYLVGSWLLLQIVDVVLPMFGLPDTLGKPVLMALLAGLPIALILAWVFEITPERIVLDPGADARRESDPHMRRTLDRLIIAVLGLALGLLLVDKLILQDRGTESSTSTTPSQSGTPERNSVAVLPFVNMSGVAENEYFSDGLTETLLHVLAQDTGLRVAARTSSFAFKGKDIDVRSIGRKLKVAAVLEGSVQRSVGRVRITAQLIETESGYHLWSQSFDRELVDIFAVQDEIANDVAQALRKTLVGEAPEPGQGLLSCVHTEDSGAYETYLRGLAQLRIGSYGSYQSAKALFKQALATDPEFIEAQVELAATYMLQADTGQISYAESEQHARALLQQVVQGHARNGRALGLLAVLDIEQSKNDRDREPMKTALDQLEIAIELSPNDAELYRHRARLSKGERRHDNAMNWLERGLSIDPMSAGLHRQRGLLHLRAGRSKAAHQDFQRTVELEPEWTAGHLALADLAMAEARFVDGFQHMRDALALDALDHEIPAMLAEAYLDLGMLAPAQTQLARALAIAPNASATRSAQLRMYLFTGDHKAAGELAGQLLRSRSEFRRDGFTLALFGYLSTMLAQKQTPQFLATLREKLPNVDRKQFKAQNRRELSIHLAALLALGPGLPRRERERRLKAVMTDWDQRHSGWREYRTSTAALELLAGNEEAARQTALADLEGGLATRPRWRLDYRDLTYMHDVAALPAVAQRLAELEQESQDARRLVAEISMK